MLIVGITGGIGSGKSVVARVLRTMGYPVFNSDESAKQIVNTCQSLKNQLIDSFGEQVYSGDKLDRKKLAKIVFDDQNALEKLNQLIHPEVRRDFEEFRKDNKDATIIFNEAAILFETGSYKNFDKMVLVVAPKQTKIERIMARDGATEEEINARMSKQWSDEKKKDFADFVLVNDDKQLLLPQIEQMLKELS